MNVVISCAGSKVANAGTLRASDGKAVEFVAQPDEVLRREPHLHYARPDDDASDGVMWRQKLLEYNVCSAQSNELNLLPAYKLYKPKIYRKLVRVFGVDNVYILSAGWGLVRASFLLPKYDITFSSPRDCKDRYKKRGMREEYQDFNHLDEHSGQGVLFLGGQNYLNLFCELTGNYAGHRIVYFNSKKEPKDSGTNFVRFETSAKTNWHYLCAERVADTYESNPLGFDPLAVT